jgi:hypothetical protein
MNRVFVLAVLFAATSAAGQQKVSDLSWLSGCWEMSEVGRGLTVTEMWMKPSGDAMLGVGRTVKSGKVIDFEFLRIVEDANGLAYLSRPSANKEDTTFRLVKSSPGELTFENLQHDFPQRIIYRVDGRKLHARIEGTKDGKTRGVDFPYTRTKCD